jgi:hypothetical protein
VQFTLAWRLVLGTLVIAWGVVVTAREASWSLPWVLVTGAGLLGLRLSVPWERDRDDGA